VMTTTDTMKMDVLVLVLLSLAMNVSPSQVLVDSSVPMENIIQMKLVMIQI
jgi:hypothetical protein